MLMSTAPMAPATRDEAAPRAVQSASGLDRAVSYGPGDVDTPAIGAPGAPGPYTRGIAPDGYRDRPWIMGQYAGFGTAEERNQRDR